MDAPCERTREFGSPIHPRDRALAIFLVVSMVVLGLALVWPGGRAAPVLSLRLAWPPEDGCAGGNATVRVQVQSLLHEPVTAELSLEDTALEAAPVAIELPANASRHVPLQARIPAGASGAVPFTARARALGLTAVARGNLTVLPCARPVPASAPLPLAGLEALLPSIAEREARTASLLAACEPKEQGFAREDCVGSVAVQTRNASLCGSLTIPGLRDWCWSTFFAPGVNPSLCSRVSEGDMRSFCLALADGDPSRCNGVASPLNRDICVSNIANALGDRSLCERIADNSTRKECLEGGPPPGAG